MVNSATPKTRIDHYVDSEHFHSGFPLYMNCWEEGFELREHDHEFLEMAYVMSGEGFHYVGDRVAKTNKGCLYILPVGTSHLFRPSGPSNKNKLLVYNLCIRSEFVDELQQWLSRFGDDGDSFSLFKGAPGSHLTLVDRNMELGGLFHQMHREYHEQPPGFQASLIAGLMQLTVRIARLLKQEDSTESKTRNCPLKPGRLNFSAILDFIHLHIAEPLTVEQLALQAGVSRRHFIRPPRMSSSPLESPISSPYGGINHAGSRLPQSKRFAQSTFVSACRGKY
ncbi:AraC family ligand binding domain-containing protein [Paenibacillus herberti]|uniref:AraC family transcriptional regulator n=1 Tax=Paenibacillus herberti TaxID=1619309 RepID=A0A229NY64_9BACL|nr:AraC family ligand binding domain-containing protein [Paenibacillus herberti]OXM14777.1 AraC family transcriptional regulator [Paenibacillus herberti]